MTPTSGFWSGHAGSVVTPTRARRVAIGAGFVVVATVAQLLRQPGEHTWDTLWAEDGRIYTTDALGPSPWRTVLRGYAGYAQVVPRVLVLGVRALPVGSVAAYAACTAALTWAVLALFVHRSTEGWITSPVLRWVLAGFSVVAPVVFYETNANLANLGWPLLFAAFWAIVSPHEAGWDVAARVVVVVAAALTTPVVALLLPWAAVMLATRRRRADGIVLGAMGLALVVQLLTMRATAQEPHPPSSVADLPAMYGVRVAASFVTGERWLDRLWIDLGVVLVVAVVVALVAFVALARPGRLAHERRWFAAGVVLTSLVLHVASVWVRGTALLGLDRGSFNAAGSRYAVVPVLLLATAVIVVADASPVRALVPFVVAWFGIVTVLSLHVTNIRSGGPSWGNEVAAAQGRCRADPALLDVRIPITPDDPTWFATVPCGRLR